MVNILVIAVNTLLLPNGIGVAFCPRVRTTDANLITTYNIVESGVLFVYIKKQ